MVSWGRQVRYHTKIYVLYKVTIALKFIYALHKFYFAIHTETTHCTYLVCCKFRTIFSRLSSAGAKQNT